MPLVKRAVEPVFISRTTLDKQVKNELEGVVVNSLAGVIKQLSSISKHAENLFGELFSEANAIFQRTAGLNGRVQWLQERVTQLDSAAKEEVKVEDFSVQNHFKSTRKEEQQNLSRETLPTALQEVYISCVRPPALNKFTAYRDDNKDGLKFYTDPNYFYDLWVKEQNKLLEKRKKRERKKNRKKKDHNPKKAIKAAQKKQYLGVDKEFITPEHRTVPQDVQQFSESAKSSPGHTSEHFAQDYRPPPPTSAQLNIPNAPPPPPPPGGPPMGAPPPPPPPAPPGQAAFQLPVGAPPPPPPLQPSYDAHRVTPTPPSMHNVPKAPAPPPPPMFNAPPAPPPPNIPAAPPGPPAPPLPSLPGGGLSAPVAVAQEPPKPKPQPDERSSFLRAIEMGMKLRSVERSDEEKQQNSQGGDVASILKRRIAVEMSDTESDSDDDSDDGDWSD